MQKTFSYLILFFMAACAQVGTPTGGEKDQTPPKIRKVSPENQAKNVKGKEITFYFDAFPKNVTFGKEVFISPILSKTPQITIIDKKIQVKFEEDLKENTTYVISISGVEDYFANNKMDSPYIYAFSTGKDLDTMMIKGNVVSGATGAGEKDFSLLLFDADSVKNNAAIFGKRPDYVAKTQESGEFVLSNVKKKKYKIYGIKDGDQSNSYNQLTELVAIDSIADVIFPDSGNVVIKKLYSFLPDEQAPRVRGYDWIGENVLAIEVNETILQDSLQIEMQDTLGKNGIKLGKPYLFKGEKKQIIFPVLRSRKENSKLIFTHLMDSLQNKIDTTFTVFSKSTANIKTFPLLQKPEFSTQNMAFEGYLTDIPKDSAEKYIFLTDSANKKIATTFSQKDFFFSLKTEKSISPKMPLFLCINAKVIAGKDSVYKYKIFYPNPEDYGTLDGNVITNGYEGKIVVILSTGAGRNGEAKAPIVLWDRKMNLTYLKPGSYNAKVVIDTDGNGCWTPGSLAKNKLPEKIIILKSPIEIKANWDLEKFELIVPTSQDKAGGGGLNSKNGKAGK